MGAAQNEATGLAKLVADQRPSAAELLAVARERAAAVNPRINVPCAALRPF